MMAISADASKGVTDRFRSLPISGLAVVAGRCVADMVNSVVGLAVTVFAGLAFGWRPDASAPAILAALGVLLLLRFAMLWVGIFVGLRVKSHEGVTAIQVLVWPLLFLSSVLSTPAQCPSGWARSPKPTRCRPQQQPYANFSEVSARRRVLVHRERLVLGARLPRPPHRCLPPTLGTRLPPPSPMTSQPSGESMMQYSLTVPLLPCRLLEESIPFSEALGRIG